MTGGGTGIGEAICRKFAREGATVIVNGLPDDPIDDVVTAILDEGGTAIPFAGRHVRRRAGQACVDAAMDAYGRLDVLINNAGVLLVGAETDKIPLDKFDEHIRCNVRTAFLMTKHALPHLRETKGNIIYAGSAAGINGEPGRRRMAAPRDSCMPSWRASPSNRRNTAYARTACARDRLTPPGLTRKPARSMPRSRKR